MSNMAYCRFQNTAVDLAACVEWASQNDWGKLSKDELAAANRMYELCELFIEAWDESDE